MLARTNRPRIKISLSLPDWILEVISVAFILIGIILLVVWYKNLPDQVVTHFNSKGEPDGFGNKSTLFLLPAFALFIYILITIVSFFPHYFNFPVKITEKNAEVQYRLAIRMLRVIKAMIIIIFTYLNYQTILTTTGKESGIGIVFLPVFLLLLTGSMIVYLVLSFNNRYID